MGKRLTIYFLLFFAVVGARAQNNSFVMSAPNAVEVGKQFRLTFSLNDENGTNLRLPQGLSNNFNVLMGPSTGYSSSTQIINGRSSTQTTHTYTYILEAKQEGTFEIRPASIEVNGEIVESNSIEIQVVKQQNQPSQPQQNNSSDNDIQDVDLGEDNLFIRVELNKRNVYRGEQLIAEVKLYVNPNIRLAGFDDIQLPTYEGFYTQDIDVPQNVNFTREVFDNKIYQVGTLKKTVLFPQQNGEITIEPFTVALIVQQQTQARSFFDDFFNNYRNVRVTITSDPVSVNVRNLPASPDNFSGGVGNFSVSSGISSENITTNDAVTYTLKINGSGNIRLIQNPELTLPSDFEIYDPQSNDNVTATDNGVSGTKTIEYLFQPRFEGDYKIPPVQFVYFNPATGNYVTRSTQEYNLHVAKGSDEQSATVVSSLRKEDVQLIGQDIHFIKQENPALRKNGYTFFGTLEFYSMYAGSSILFLLLFVVYRKKARENANIALVRNKKANSVAKKRLKAAASFMKQNNNEAFHESILKAFWGYLSDKLGIPVADLNRESAVNKLKHKNVQPGVIDDFTEIIDQCEFARYAPSGGAEARSDLYSKAESTMSRLEKQIKR